MNEWPITQVIRRALLRWQIKRDTARLERLHKMCAWEIVTVERTYRREIENVETAISESSAALTRLSAEALTRRAMSRVTQ